MGVRIARCRERSIMTDIERALLHVKIAKSKLNLAVANGATEYRDLAVALMWIEEDLERRIESPR